MPQILLLIGGLAAILAGAQILVEGSLNLARKYRIPEFLLGLTLLTVGTSIPELAISVTGALNRTAGVQVSSLILGQIVGSGIANIGLILGLAGLFGSLLMSHKMLRMQAYFLVGSVLLMIVFGQDGYYSKAEGMSLMFMYVGYLFMLPKFITSRHVPKVKTTISLTKAILWIVLGLVTILISSQIIVQSGVSVAKSLGVPQSIIGIFLIGVGTSFPELVVTLTAAWKKSNELSIGNIIGSNIFNILMALGASSAVSGLEADKTIVQKDMSVLLVISLMLVIFFFTGQKMERKESIWLILAYLLYVGITAFQLF